MSVEWDCRIECGVTEIVALAIGETGRQYLLCDPCLRTAVDYGQVHYGEPPTHSWEPFTIHGTHVLDPVALQA